MRLIYSRQFRDRNIVYISVKGYLWSGESLIFCNEMCDECHLSMNYEHVTI